MQISNVSWPAILHFAGEAEITFIKDLNDWESHSRHLKLHPQDSLIDSTGMIFIFNDDGDLTPQSIIRLDALIFILQKHMASNATLCATKISAASIAECIQLASTLPNTQ